MIFGDTFKPQNTNKEVGKNVVLGLQHTFTMFGSTVLVPILLGIDISIALFMAGVATLIYHFITKGKIPVFIGSSFAFLAPTIGATALFGFEYALGGLVVAGLIFLIPSILVYFLGANKLLRFFPPVITGSIAMAIGLELASVSVEMSSTNWFLALLSFASVVSINVYLKGFLKLLPVLIGVLVSYSIAILITVLGIAKLVDFMPIAEAAWFGLPNFTVAKFDINAIIYVAPVALVLMIEHVGDIVAVGAICKRNFIKDPGLHRTFLADGLSTSFAAMFGGPGNTTYSENIGVLALTRSFNSIILRIAALFAICLSFVPKLSALIHTIPSAIIGGISIVLFGMIASVGASIYVENSIDFKLPRNLIIVAAILVLAVGGASIPFSIGDANFEIQGVALAAIVGVLLNVVLPGAQKYSFENDEEAS